MKKPKRKSTTDRVVDVLMKNSNSIGDQVVGNKKYLNMLEKAAKKKLNRKIRKAICFERKIKTVTETGWSVWSDVDRQVSPIFYDKKYAWEWFCRINNVLKTDAKKLGYRCLRTTARGIL